MQLPEITQLQQHPQQQQEEVHNNMSDLLPHGNLNLSPPLLLDLEPLGNPPPHNRTPPQQVDSTLLLLHAPPMLLQERTSQFKVQEKPLHPVLKLRNPPAQ